MGIDYNAARFLLFARAHGIRFGKTATIGRQGLYLKKPELQRAFMEFDRKVEAELLDLIYSGGYAEHLLMHLGADSVDSFDYSRYEGANEIHDLNLPFPDPLKNRYDLVLDGGSLEHIFHFPNAIGNCMEMLKLGGHFISLTPCNSFVGHGFYQYNPELFYRIFTPENGFEIIFLGLCEKNHWYAVKDPGISGQRTRFHKAAETTMAILAKKNERKAIFGSWPMQSDYAALWKNQPADLPPGGWSLLAKRLREKIRSIYRTRIVRYDRRSIRRISLSREANKAFDTRDKSRP